MRSEIVFWLDSVWEQIVNKVGRTSCRIGAGFPYVSIDGRYNQEADDWWTNGFWPGLLWLIYRETGEERLRELAAACEDKLDAPLHEYTPLHHDVGFMWSLSSVAHYKLLGHEKSRLRALTAASHLAGRFNPKGGFIRAWNQPERVGWAIIDCLMNLPLLYWASEETGDPRFKHVAMAHADTAIREFLRPDGSVHHIVCFDPDTGRRTGAIGGQGYAPESAWSRGAAWAIYGFALSWRYTGEARYAEASRSAADFFLEQLPPDQLPPWDFRAPQETDMAMDSTAAVCAASGLLELAGTMRADEATSYRGRAEHILRAIHAGCGAFDDPEEEAMIRFGTANRPQGKYVNTPIIYGDFFFAEAVGKLRGNTQTFW